MILILLLSCTFFISHDLQTAAMPQKFKVTFDHSPRPASERPSRPIENPRCIILTEQQSADLQLHAKLSVLRFRLFDQWRSALHTECANCTQEELNSSEKHSVLDRINELQGAVDAYSNLKEALKENRFLRNDTQNSLNVIVEEVRSWCMQNPEQQQFLQDVFELPSNHRKLAISTLLQMTDHVRDDVYPRIKDLKTEEACGTSFVFAIPK